MGNAVNIQRADPEIVDKFNQLARYKGIRQAVLLERLLSLYIAVRDSAKKDKAAARLLIEVSLGPEVEP